MPRIPTIGPTISALTGRSNGSIDSYSTPNAFGAQAGAALTGVGAQIGGLANDMYVRQEKKRNETVANSAAQFDFTRKELEIRNEVGPDGAGLQEKTLQAFDVEVEQRANTIDDPIARTKFRNEMAKQRNAVSSRSVSQEFSLDAANSKAQADASLMALENKIMADPDLYDTYIEQGAAVIDTRTDMPAYMRENMKQVWKQNSAKARFTGMLESATTVTDIDGIANELTAASKAEGKDDFVGRDWAKELAPAEYESLVNKMGTVRKAIITKADADARAALDTIEERAKDVTAIIPRDELMTVSKVVKQSQNPITVSRFARIARDQDIIAEAKQLPLAEQRAQINAAKGNPATAFPGVPERVSRAANDAAAKFGVSASFLATTAQKEYGGNFTRTSRKTNAAFAPRAVHDGVDLRNVRPDVVEAATVAGELFGAPLQATSAYRSQDKQNAIRAKGDPNRVTVAKESKHTDASALDISTVGMSEDDKARMVGALVDAGFTGIGEYGTHVHADFRDAVPASFGDRGGKTWGGWTYLSPAVADQLKRRGFAGGKTAKEVQRAAAVANAEDIDYSKGTSIVNEDGKPTTGVVGVMQFASGTFLPLMRDPRIAAKIGVDTSKMTDEQILKLREDPDVSVMAAAALAVQNRGTMEGTLGRRVDDAELYVAHFLGAGGAVGLIKARDQQSEQSAAALLPKAAAANRPVFYDKSGKARTVEQVYNRLTADYVAAPTRVGFDDTQTRERVYENTKKQLNDNPMGFVRENGSHDVPTFDPNNMVGYGAAVRSVAEFYSIPIADMKVLEPEAIDTLKKAINEGTADDAVAVIASMQSMGSDVARAALKQLGEKDNVYAYAGDLSLERGQSSTAGDIVRGQKRLAENPDIKNDIGMTGPELSVAFRTATGNALNEASPRVRQDIQDAALAHYVETVLARGKAPTFDQDMYNASVQAVMGGVRGSEAVGEVNGELTALPPGINAETMEAALQNMTLLDWSEQSPDGMPPRYIDGTIIAAEDLADEARLRAIGAGQYKVQLDDGTFAVTDRVLPNGRMEVYVFEPNPEALQRLATSVNADPVIDRMPELLGEVPGQGMRNFTGEQ